jgi:hypothetical protein
VLRVQLNHLEDAASQVNLLDASKAKVGVAERLTKLMGEAFRLEQAAQGGLENAVVEDVVAQFVELAHSASVGEEVRLDCG